VTAAAPDLHRILVVKLADLGDLLTATPALRALRLSYPTADIRALVTPHSAPLLRGNNAVDGVLHFAKADFDHLASLANPFHAVPSAVRAVQLAASLRAGNFDVVVLLHHLTTRWGTFKYRALLSATGAPVRVGLDNGRGTFLTRRAPDHGFGALHEVDYWLSVVAKLGAANPAPQMELHLSSQERADADARWSQLGLDGASAVALHPGSGSFSVARRWAPDRFAAVGDALAVSGHSIVVLAGPGEEPLARAVQESMRASSTLLVSSGDVRVAAAMLRKVRLFVGNDSGLMHCAAALGVPVVAVFGLSNHRAWGPYPPAEHRVVRLDLSCSPCFYTDFSLGTPQGCAARTCLQDLRPELVIAAALEMLDSGRVMTAPAGRSPNGI